MIRFISVLFLIAAGVSSLASETDPYTSRKDLEDSTVWLNQRMNAALDESAGKTKSCDSRALEKQIFKDWGGVFYAKIEDWSKNNPKAKFIPIEKSIYSEVEKVKGSHSWRKLTKFSMYYSPGVFRVGDVIVGDDKLGHFLQLGYSMYYAVEKKKDKNFKDIRSLGEKMAEFAVDDYKFIRNSKLMGEDLVLAFADFQENTEWGMTATLVKSYADMAANYGGYLFWSKLTNGDKPYFVCKNKKWQRQIDFDWKDYVNAAWDEAINCNDYDSRIQTSVEAQILKRGLGGCPVNLDACIDLKKSLGDKADRLLHPKCFAAQILPK